MNFKNIKPLLITALLLTACETAKVKIPQRPPAVPPSAVWAGGADGGAWIQCKNQGHTHYACQVFHDTNGELSADGLYALKQSVWDQEKKQSIYFDPQTVPTNLVYTAYDGVLIYLEDSYVLKPL